MSNSEAVCVEPKNKKQKSASSIKFPQKNADFEKHKQKQTKEISNNSYNASHIYGSFELLEDEFTPNNIANSPPNMFMSGLKQRMDCYFSPQC